MQKKIFAAQMMSSHAMHAELVKSERTCRRPYILVAMALALSLALGACAPKSHVGPDGLPHEEQVEQVDPADQAELGSGKTSSTNDVLHGHNVDFGADRSPLVFDEDKDVVASTEVLDLKLPSTYKDGKKLTHVEREALLTVSNLDRGLTVEDYKIIMPYFAFYVHKSRITIQHMVKNADPYIAYVRKTFRENGIPEELAYLGMIESIYRPTAVSPAGAAGVWQFMPGTGKAYGLRQDWWVDERRDVYKATQAAVKYLKVLYNYFDDWLLVVTAYNAGEGTVLRALKETGTDNFFDLVRKSTGPKARLKPESQRYAPSFLAVTKIMRNLESLGFHDFAKNVAPAVPVKVPAGTDLLALSDAMGMSWKEFAKRNAAFRRYVSSPEADTVIYLDAKYSHAANTFLAKPHKTYAGWKSYKIKKGDTLGGISHRTGVPVSVLCRVNNVSPKHLRIGSTIMIPSKAGADLQAGLAHSGKQKNQSTKQTSKREAPQFTGENRNYIVKKGDTLYDIAHRHDLGWKVLMEANGLTSRSRLRVGQSLNIPVKSSDSGGKETVAAKNSAENKAAKTANAEVKPREQKGSQERIVHVVKKGETLYSIARKYGTDVAVIMKENHIDNPKAVDINQCLEIPVTANTPASAGTYTVQKGDTLWSIARRFKMPATVLMERNGLKQNSILHLGDVLNIDRY